MSSDREGDVIDYVSDNSEHEDGSLFLPAPDGGPDHWTIFFSGILLGIAGGALAPVSPWLAGALILVGYGLAAYTLKDTSSAFGRALRFGFVIPAVLGGALLLGEILTPDAAWRAVSALGERHLIFPGFALMPWLLGILRYAYALVR